MTFSDTVFAVSQHHFMFLFTQLLELVKSNGDTKKKKKIETIFLLPGTTRVKVEDTSLGSSCSSTVGPVNRVGGGATRAR